MIGSKQVKALMQKARRRISAFSKAFKQGKLDKEKMKKRSDNTILDFQEFLKNSNKKFRRYNRKLGMYEPITPRGKLKQSEEFNNFVLDINQYINETRTVTEELDRKAIKTEYGISDDILNMMDIQGIDFDEYSSDSDEIKHIHLDNAMSKYNIDLLNSEQMKQISKIAHNIDNYNLRDIYDAVFHIADKNEGSRVFNEI